MDKILALPPKTRVMLLAPVVRRQKGEFRDVIERLAREGFVRARVDGELVELGATARASSSTKRNSTHIEAVVDRLVIDDKIRVRLGDSVETALRWGEGVMFTLHQLPEESEVQSPESEGQGRARHAPTSGADADDWIETLHSNKNVFAGHGQELRSADAETFFLQRAGRRLPGLPRPRPEDGFRRRHWSCPTRKSRSKGRGPAVAARAASG